MLTFAIGIFLALTKYGNVRLGNQDAPETSRFRWTATNVYPDGRRRCVLGSRRTYRTFSQSSSTFWCRRQNGRSCCPPALAQSFMHWGFLAWAIAGTLTAIVMMYYCYNKKLPFKPRTLLYPIFKEKIMTGPLGILVDASCIIAVVAGTVGPIGFLGLQVMA